MRKLILLVALAATACSPDYPFDKPGTWSLGAYGGSNDANLRAMIVNPHDLVQGAAVEPTSLGAEAAPPVKRLLTGKRYPLPASGVAQVSAVGGGEQQQAPQGDANAQ